MQSQRGSLFYKILLIFVLLGTLPALLISARLLYLNENILQADQLGGTLNSAVINQVNAQLWTEATANLVYIFLISGLLALFFSGSLIGPIRKLQLHIENMRKGGAVDIDLHTGDEIEQLGSSFTSLGHELLRLQHGLENRVAERTQSLEQRSLHLQTAAEIAREAANLTNLDAFFLRAVNLVRERFNVYFVAIFLLDDAKRNAVLRAGTGEVGRLLFQRGYKQKVGDVGIVGFVSVSGKTRLVRNVADDFAFHREALLPDTRSEVALPLIVENQVIGVLDIHSNRVDDFDEENMAALELVGDQLAIAIQNNKLVQQLQVQLNEISALYQRYVQEEWIRPTIQDQSVGYVYDTFSVLPISQAFPDTLIDKLKSGNAILLSAQECQELGLKAGTSILVSPLMLFNQLVGVIGVESEDSQHHWSANEVAAIQDITKQIALALDNARLLEESRYRTDQLRLLQAITSTSVSHNHLDDLLHGICNQLLKGFGLQQCEAVLFDPGGETGTLIASVSASHEVQDMPLGSRSPVTGNGAFHAALDARKTLVVYNAQNDPDTLPIQEMLREYGTNVLLISPLISQGNVIGIIRMHVTDPTRQVSPEEITLLDQISLQVSSAVDLTLTFEAAQRRAQFERQLSEVTGRIRETLDLHTILRTTAQEVRQTFDVPEVIVRLAPSKPTRS